MYVRKIMTDTTKHAMETMMRNIGGPFGAAIVKNGEVICVESNSVLRDKDPTAHAEINAIRSACRKLKTYDLSDCELYATGSPCPMCLSAIIWANIKTVYYSGKYEDCKKIGFRDDFIFNFIKNDCKNDDIVKLELHDNDLANTLYNAYKTFSGELY